MCYRPPLQRLRISKNLSCRAASRHKYITSDLNDAGQAEVTTLAPFSSSNLDSTHIPVALIFAILYKICCEARHFAFPETERKGRLPDGLKPTPSGRWQAGLTRISSRIRLPLRRSSKASVYTTHTTSSFGFAATKPITNMPMAGSSGSSARTFTAKHGGGTKSSFQMP